MSIDYRPDNTIIFTIGRMNPPTPGHLFIIQKLIEEGIQKNVGEVFIILSKTNDNDENPIPCPEKKRMLGHYDDASRTMINSLKKEMIDNTEDEGIKERIDKMIVNIICVPEKKGATPFTSIIDIVKSKSEIPDLIPDLNLFLIIGGDRENMLDSVTDVMFKKYPNVKSVDGIVLHRKSMDKYKKMSPELLSDIDISEVRENNGFSGTLIRKLVKNDFYDKFKEVYFFVCKVWMPKVNNKNYSWVR
jgi:nicotinic acid mononucleotide adenylyltransferase